MQFTTVISDLILCVASIFMVMQLNRSSSFAKKAGTYGFFIIGTSAGLGSIHFWGITTLDPVYHFFVGLSNYVGVPLIGIGYFHIGINKIKEPMLLPIFGVLFLVYIVFGYFVSFPLLATILGGLAMGVVIIASIRNLSGGTKDAAMFGISGAILFILAGLVIGTTGAIGPILKVDIFHVTLALAVYLLGTSLKRLG